MCGELFVPGRASGVDSATMFSVFSMKAARLLLSVGVSIWIAGGCLFGCTGSVVGAEEEPQTVVAASHSCHAAHQKNNSKQFTGVPSFAPSPREMMKDCPLAVGATAATSKNNGHVPAPGRGPVSAAPLIEKTNVPSHTYIVSAYLPNRGPTHLRCCVFLI
jgi:hypothetical protein